MSLLKKMNIDVWNVGIIEQTIEDLLNGHPFKIRYMVHKYHDRFFADPFLYKFDNNYYYIFAEELKFWEKKGRIVLLQINRKNMVLKSKTLLIDEEYHLSYPFYYQNKIYPESAHSGNWFSYDFDGCIASNKTKASDYPLIDASILNYNNEYYAFATTKGLENEEYSVLKLFEKKGELFVPYDKNPIKNDSRTARSAGHFFVVDGILYRPVQDCEGRYGNQVRIMKSIISNDEYKEEEVACFSAKGQKKYNSGFHTFNVENGFIVVDGLEKRLTLRSIIYRKMKKMCKRLDKEYQIAR